MVQEDRSIDEHDVQSGHTQPIFAKNFAILVLEKEIKFGNR
jgi:hypothetical protein